MSFELMGICKGWVHDLIVRQVKYKYVHNFFFAYILYGRPPTAVLSNEEMVNSSFVKWGNGQRQFCQMRKWSTAVLSNKEMVNSSVVKWGNGQQQCCQVGRAVLFSSHYIKRGDLVLLRNVQRWVKILTWSLGTVSNKLGVTATVNGTVSHWITGFITCCVCLLSF